MDVVVKFFTIKKTTKIQRFIENQKMDKFYFTSLLLISILFPQELEPIQAGVAPPSGVYAPGINVLHYVDLVFDN